MLICGEGPHEIGVRDHWDERLRKYVQLDGWMQPIIRRTLTDEIDCNVRTRRELQVLSRDPLKRRLPEGHGAKAYLAKREAITGGYDMLIFMVDADSNDIRTWHRIVAEIKAGFDLLSGEIRCIPCVPMAASESWLLSDPAAWNREASYSGKNLPPRPEAIWGARDDPTGNHPHRIFLRICIEADVADDREIRMRIAGAMNLEHSRARCPLSMEPFLAELEA